MRSAEWFYQKMYQAGFLFLCFLFQNSLVYGFERGPIWMASNGPTTFDYVANPQSACEIIVNSFRGTPYYPVPGSTDAEILSIWTYPVNQNGNPISSGPVAQYRCAVKILRIYGLTHNPPTQVIDINYAGGALPACNVGASYSADITNETICTIPNTIPDISANAGQPQEGSCTGNPVNSATGNKFAEEIDIASSGSLSFSRYYNAKGLSGGSQIGATWSHTFNRNLFINVETVTATRPDGKSAGGW